MASKAVNRHWPVGAAGELAAKHPVKAPTLDGQEETHQAKKIVTLPINVLEPPHDGLHIRLLHRPQHVGQLREPERVLADTDHVPAGNGASAADVDFDMANPAPRFDADDMIDNAVAGAVEQMIAGE